MVRIDKPYTFEGPNGTVGLLDLFEGRPQLVMHHFMWMYDIDADGDEHPRDTGCPSCSSAADGIGNLRQLHVRNTTLVAVTRAPYDEARRVSRADGLDVPLVLLVRAATSTTTSTPRSTNGSRRCRSSTAPRPSSPRPACPTTASMRGDWPGISAFLRVGDEVFHTYSTFGRGIEEFHNGYPYLDLTALGRQEAWEEPKGRATPLGLQVGGPNMRLPDEYDV